MLMWSGKSVLLYNREARTKLKFRDLDSRRPDTIFRFESLKDSSGAVRLYLQVLCESRTIKSHNLEHIATVTAMTHTSHTTYTHEINLN